MNLNVGDILRENESVFVDAFEVDLRVRNFVEPPGTSGEDDYLDPVGTSDDGTTDPHPDNPVSTTGEVNPFFGEAAGRAYGADADTDVIIHLPEGVDVVGPDGGKASDGAELVKSTEIERVGDGAKFSVSHVYFLDNGRQRAFARRVE